MPDPTPLPAAARDAILEWYTAHGRALPFRGTTDPYAILVSEAMAQQTQAARAGDAWTLFMEAFPTAAALAVATPADVLRAWQGLGYNRRALNLWRAARRIVADHGGAVPVDLVALEALPGVGPYTARAVAAIAFGMPVGAVDTNVRRVLGRIVAGEASLDRRTLQAAADDAVPPGQAGAWTHALMDLGATVCRPQRPACPACPALAWCRYAVGQRAGTPAKGSPANAPATAGSPGTVPRTKASPARTEPALDASDMHQPTRSSGAQISVAFPATSRWLRGRIVDRLRATAGDGWTVIDGPIGTHDRVAVSTALQALARDGLVEVEVSEPLTGAWRVRLPIT